MKLPGSVLYRVSRRNVEITQGAGAGRRLILPVVSDLKPLINHPHDVLEPFVGPLLNVIEVEHPVLRRRRFDLFDGRPMRNLCVCTLLIFSSQGGPCPLRNSLTSSPRHSRHPGHTLLRKMLFSLFIISLRSGFALCSDPAGRAPAQHPPLPLLLFSAGGQTESEGRRKELASRKYRPSLKVSLPCACTYDG